MGRKRWNMHIRQFKNMEAKKERYKYLVYFGNDAWVFKVVSKGCKT